MVGSGHPGTILTIESWPLLLVLVIRACQWDMIWHFGSSYCHNDEFVIYPSHVIKKHWNKYLWKSFQLLYIEEKQILKRTTLIFSMLTIKSWARNHSKCIRKMHGFMFRSRICRFHIETDKVYLVQILCDVIAMTLTLPHALCIEINIVYYLTTR